MLRAINYLRMNNIMNRVPLQDLKPENFLLATDETWPCESASIQQVCTKAGTANWVAPETWSIGVIAYLLLSGKHPFTGKTVEQAQKVKTANFVTEGKHWKGVLADGKGCVQALQKIPMAAPMAPCLVLNDLICTMAAMKMPSYIKCILFEAPKSSASPASPNPRTARMFRLRCRCGRGHEPERQSEDGNIDFEEFFQMMRGAENSPKQRRDLPL